MKAGVLPIIVLPARWLIAMIALAVFAPAGAAQAADAAERAFDRPTWRRATEGLDYGQIRRPSDPAAGAQRPPLDKPGKGNDRKKSPFSFTGGGVWLRALMKAFLLLGGAFLLFLLLRGLLGLERPPRNRRVTATETVFLDLEQIEEAPMAYDLTAYIEQALAAGRYDLAVRLHYLTVLKELSIRRRIRWKKDKTNNDYLQEMRSSELFPLFSTLTGLFERVWYGERAPTVTDYETIERQFRQFTTRLGPITVYETQP